MQKEGKTLLLNKKPNNSDDKTQHPIQTNKTQEEIETDHKFYLFHDYCKNSEQMLLTELQIWS